MLSRHHAHFPALGLFLLITAGTAACTPKSEPEIGASLVVLLESGPMHLDPRIATDQASARVFDLVYNGLVTKDTSGRFVPDLASSWEVLDGGRRYRFHLRPNVSFHDGSSLTAADVVWTFSSILDGNVITPKRGSFPQFTTVEAVDELTIDFHLLEPYGALVANLTSFLGIVPAGRSTEAMNRLPMGTGPFRFLHRTPDTLTLEAFDGYRDGRPKLDRVVLKEVPDATVRALELRKGSADLAVNALPPDMVMAFRRNEAFRVVEDPGSNYSYIGLNLEDPVLSSRDVRRALASGLDRELLIRSLWRGLAVKTETLLPPGHWARHDELPSITFDPDHSKHLLDGAGFPDPDGDGPDTRFSLVYKTSTDETALLQAQIIQSMLAEIGVDIEIRSHEFATFYNDIKKGNFQLFSLTWTGIADPDVYSLILHSQRIPPAGSNRGRYRNSEFDRLVDAGAREVDQDSRRAQYLRAQEIVAEDLPYISLFIKANVAVLPAGLAGYRNYPGGEFFSLKEVHWIDG